MESATDKQPSEGPKRRALGKGLESLLPRMAPTQASPRVGARDENSQGDGNAREIPLDAIDPSPYQTRQKKDEHQLKELAASIAATGVVQPIVVRPLPDGRFQLIAGERRWAASRLAGKSTVPAVVRVVSDAQAAEMTIVENLQRADLNPMEQARAYDRLGREFHLTQEQMAMRTGKDRATVSNFLRLLRLPEGVQRKVEGGDLSFGHARCLLTLPTDEQIASAAQKVIALSMSVRQTESYVQGLQDPERRQKKNKVKQPLADPNVRDVEEQLQRALSLKVSVEDQNGRGRMIIHYASLEDFDALVTLLSRDL